MVRNPPVFARSIFFGTGPHALGSRDRITPVLACARELETTFDAIFLETPDTDEAKARSAMCRRLAPLLDAAFASAGLLKRQRTVRARLHVLFIDATNAYVGSSEAPWGSAWPMGIPRISMPRDAPSRSAMKLAEALVTFIAPDDVARLVRPGLRAVDLGAAPGGWSWQLASRGVRVTAIDNANLAPNVAADPLVEHVRADGFRYRPRRPVDWMVCDMVEQPSRIAALAARWMASGDCGRTIFNLKLPMKKRYAEVLRCRDIVAQELARSGSRCRLRIKHLYHDREEVTAFCARS